MTSYQLEELMLQGVVFCQSSEPDTKSDQEGKNKVMLMVKESRTVIESDSSFLPCAASAEDLDQNVWSYGLGKCSHKTQTAIR